MSDVIQHQFCWNGEGLGRLEIGSQKGPFSYTMALDQNDLWMFEMSAPLFGDKTAQFDLKRENLTRKENAFLVELLGSQNFGDTELQYELAFAFKNILRNLKNPDCDADLTSCLVDNGKIVFEKSEKTRSLMRTINARVELFGQSEKYFDRIIFSFSEGQEDTNLQKIKLVMKIQSCSNVRNVAKSK